MSIQVATFNIDDDPLAQFLSLNSDVEFIDELARHLAIQVIIHDDQGRRTGFFHHTLNSFRAPYTLERLRRHLGPDNEIRFLAPLNFTPHGCRAEGHYIAADHLTAEQVLSVVSHLGVLTRIVSRHLLRDYLLGQAGPEHGNRDIRRIVPRLLERFLAKDRLPRLKVADPPTRRERKQHRRNHPEPQTSAPPDSMGSPANVDLEDYIDNFVEGGSSPDFPPDDPKPDASLSVEPCLRELAQRLSELEVQRTRALHPNAAVRNPGTVPDLDELDARLLERIRQRGPDVQEIGYERHRIGNRAHWPAGTVLVVDWTTPERRLENHTRGAYVLSANQAVASPDAGEPAGGNLRWTFPGEHRVKVPLLLPIASPTDSISGNAVALRLTGWLEVQYRTRPDGTLVLQDLTLSEIQLVFH